MKGRIVAAALLFAALLFAFQAPTFACGHCVEDKIASVYDHAVVARALAMKHQILFFAIDGRLAGTAAERQILQRAAASASGVHADSVRVSTETASLSVAFDPQHTSIVAVEHSLQSKLARKSLSLQLVRVMDKPSEFKIPAQRVNKM
jgi:hypothetical protein